jgi:pseudaminic acid biosynthesis-associated methylase
MTIETKQTDFWSGEFGKEYTDRNTAENIIAWNENYIKLYGVSRFDMFNTFLSGLDKESKILEVGCNTAQQLSALQTLGFKNLYGIELQPYAVEKAKSITRNINVIQGSAFDIPFKDGYFDLVMTNGVLIHISPDDIANALSEIVRCSKKYIMGFEYFSKESKEVNYRGNKGFLWKMNYAQAYLDKFSSLSLVKEVQYPYIITEEKGNIDSLFLLKKQ